MDVDQVMKVVVHHAFLAEEKGSQELVKGTCDRVMTVLRP